MSGAHVVYRWQCLTCAAGGAIRAEHEKRISKAAAIRQDAMDHALQVRHDVELVSVIMVIHAKGSGDHA